MCLRFEFLILTIMQVSCSLSLIIMRFLSACKVVVLHWILHCCPVQSKDRFLFTFFYKKILSSRILVDPEQSQHFCIAKHASYMKYSIYTSQLAGLVKNLFKALAIGIYSIFLKCCKKSSICSEQSEIISPKTSWITTMTIPSTTIPPFKEGHNVHSAGKLNITTI